MPLVTLVQGTGGLPGIEFWVTRHAVEMACTVVPTCQTVWMNGILHQIERLSRVSISAFARDDLAKNVMRQLLYIH